MILHSSDEEGQKNKTEKSNWNVKYRISQNFILKKSDTRMYGSKLMNEPCTKQRAVAVPPPICFVIVY